MKVLTRVPFFKNERDGEKRSDDYKPLVLDSSVSAHAVQGFLASSSFYVYFVFLSDAYHCGRDLPLSFPAGLDSLTAPTRTALEKAAKRYEDHLFANTERRRIRYKATGWIEYDEFYPRKSKGLADEIDTVLAEHYGFTEEELDFILNYDIKYRLGLGRQGTDETEDSDEE